MGEEKLAREFSTKIKRNKKRKDLRGKQSDEV